LDIHGNGSSVTNQILDTQRNRGIGERSSRCTSAIGSRPSESIRLNGKTRQVEGHILDLSNIHCLSKRLQVVGAGGFGSIDASKSSDVGSNDFHNSGSVPVARRIAPFDKHSKIASIASQILDRQNGRRVSERSHRYTNAIRGSPAEGIR
jgi:hypothetical protein